MALTERELESLAKGFGTAMKEEFARRDAALRSLGDRLAELEARPKGLDYHGVHADGELYQLNDCVTRSGGLWICVVKSTSATPGDSTDWQLAVKRGQAR